MALIELGRFYYGWFDPVYAYLMNGLTFALGSTDIGHTDHPGTPLQLFCALIIRIVGAFRGMDTEHLAEDVLTHAEFYLFILSGIFVFINALVLFFLGKVGYKATGNKALSLIIQASPLLAFVAIRFMPAVATETVLTFSSLLLVILILQSIASDGNNESFALVFPVAILSGLIVSTKISAFPVLAIPLFFFKGWKKKSLFLVLSLIVSFLFVLPVLPEMKHFVDFIGEIFTHTGSYGQGEETLVDWTAYFSSMRLLLLGEWPFTFHIFILIAGVFYVLFKKDLAPVLKRIFWGIFFSTLFALLVVSRHYSFHYLLPVYVAALPLQVYFVYSLLPDRIKHIHPRYSMLFVLGFVFIVFLRAFVLFHFYPNLKNPVGVTKAEIDKLGDAPFVVVTHTSKGTAFPEPALQFGLAYTGTRIRPTYRTILAKHFPGNYLWNAQGEFSDWLGTYLPQDVFSRHKTLCLYNRSNGCDEAFQEIIQKLNASSLLDFCRLERIFDNPHSGEVLVKAEVDTANLHAFFLPAETIRVTMEKRTGDGRFFLDEREIRIFEGGMLQTFADAFRGSCSYLMDPSRTYGLKTSLPVNPKERFRFEVWMKNASGQNVYLVASAPNSNDFYQTSKTIMPEPEVWRKMEMVFQLPENYPDSLLQLYLFVPEPDSVWVDELVVERYGNK
ncbi:MAG TPA: hypothetical protein PLK12_08560 [Prolixibacteraceae bacterium]|nr:hypothetical protein [Prolixibacteraceae bacterium]